jgi:integrase
VSGRSRQEVREALLELALRHRQGSLSPPSHLSVGQWLEEWLRLQEGRLRLTTLRTYRQALTPLFPLLGAVRLASLSPLHIAHALEELRRGGKGDRQVALSFAYLRAALRSAVAMGLLSHDPSDRVPRPKQGRQEARDWTLVDMRRFLRAAQEDERPLALMLALMLLTGLRPGEAAGLQWGDIDWRAGTLRVRRAISWEGNARWHLHPPKTRAGERTIALSALALSLLQRLPREGIYLFWRERPPPPWALSRSMGELCQRANVPRRPAHYLRHCHATLLAASGLDVKTLQRRLGHSQASVTLDVYAHALSEMDRRAAEMVDKALDAQ